MRSIIHIALSIAMLSLLSCERETVKTRHVRTLPAPKPVQLSTDLTWTVPASWKEVPNTGPLRTTKYEVSPQPGTVVRISITPLRGPAGGPLPNTNRWRGQIGLAAITESQLGEISEWVDVSVGKAQIINVAGLAGDTTSSEVIYAAIVPYKQRTWFIKIRGPREAMDDDTKARFVEFVRSIKSK